MAKIKVSIVDDHQLFISALSCLLENFENVRVIHTALNGKELIENLRKNCPDIILLDVSMPIMDGYETLEYIKLKYPTIKVIILSFCETYNHICCMMQKGADSYLNKNVSPEVLEDAIHSVYEVGYYFTNKVQAAMKTKIVGNSKNKFFPNFSLTVREKSIINLICKEYTTFEIASKLFVSEKTIEADRVKILKKVGAKNIAGIVKFAYMNDMIDIPTNENSIS